MSKSRLETLTDGVFAIVMTLLIMQIRVPELQSPFMDRELFEAIVSLWPLFAAFSLSFILLTSMWITHHFLITMLTRKVNRWLITLNSVFLGLISVIPFSSHLLGAYPLSIVSVTWYSINVFLIYLFIFFLRDYIWFSDSVDSANMVEIGFTHKDWYYGSVRIVMNCIACIFAILIALVHPILALPFLLMPAIINIIPGAVSWLIEALRLDIFYKDNA